jgi:hypothetical protein
MARKNTIQLLKDMDTNETITDKTLHFYNSDGVEKVFEVHRYGNDGTLLFKKKSSISIA